MHLTVSFPLPHVEVAITTLPRTTSCRKHETHVISLHSQYRGHLEPAMCQTCQGQETPCLSASNSLGLSCNKNNPTSEFIGMCVYPKASAPIAVSESFCHIISTYLCALSSRFFYHVIVIPGDRHSLDTDGRLALSV